MSQRPTHAYIGTKRYCDCIVAMCADQYDDQRGRNSTARMVADMVRQNLVVERIALTDPRARQLKACPHLITDGGQGILALEGITDAETDKPISANDLAGDERPQTA